MVEEQFRKLTPEQIDVLREALEMFREGIDDQIANYKNGAPILELQMWKTTTELLEMVWK